MFSRGIWLLVRWRTLYASYKLPTFSRIGRDETQQSSARSLPARQSLECSSSQWETFGNSSLWRQKEAKAIFGGAS